MPDFVDRQSTKSASTGHPDATEEIPDSFGITARGWQIFALIVISAKPNKQIAFDLGITEGTVKAYLSQFSRALGLKNRTDMSRWWVAHCEDMGDLVRRDKL